MEEGTDVKPFDIQPIDQMLEAYQHEDFITNFNGPGESRYNHNHNVLLSQKKNNHNVLFVINDLLLCYYPFVTFDNYFL